MKKFLVLYRASQSGFEQMMKAPPEQQKAGMDAWMAWSKKAGSAVVDLGLPLGEGASVNKGSVGKATTTVRGFSVLQGESMGDITKLLADHPHFMMQGGTIEVLETMQIPGM